MDGARAQDGVRVAARYGARIAHVETVGKLFSGKTDVGGASGLLIGDKYVLTNDHVVPDRENYETLDINVRLMSRTAAPIAVKGVTRDKGRDIALLELADAVNDAAGDRCPMPVVSDPKRFPMGSQILFLGYPVDRDLSITSGLLSNQSGDHGWWQTNALINYGNSGGPAFDIAGELVGIAVGGIVDIDIGGEKKAVTGINFLIPVATIKQSTVFAAIERIEPGKRCWRDVDALIAASETTNMVPFPGASSVAGLPAPEHLSRDYTVSVTKDDHPNAVANTRSYELSYEADPGYRISKCLWRGDSENHQSDLVCNPGAGGASAKFTFRLASGPFFDRWRGWLHGTITLMQERK